MKKKILYIILAFFTLGCNTHISKPSPPQQLLPPKYAELHLSKKPVIIKNAEFSYTQTLDEDEQLKQIITEKIKEAYEENRENIIIFLIKWIHIFFGTILVLYWLVQLLNLLLPPRLGFIIVWYVLFLLAITLVLTL